jgi:hypothetical protein
MLLNLTGENGLAYFFLSISDEEKKDLQHYGATTFSIMALSIMTLSIIT